MHSTPFPIPKQLKLFLIISIAAFATILRIIFVVHIQRLLISHKHAEHFSCHKSQFMDEMLELVTCRLFVAAGESSIYCSSGRSCFLPIIACIQLAYSCKQHRCLSCSSQSMQMRMPLCSGLSILLNLLRSLQPRELLALGAVPLGSFVFLPMRKWRSS